MEVEDELTGVDNSLPSVLFPWWKGGYYTSFNHDFLIVLPALLSCLLIAILCGYILSKLFETTRVAEPLLMPDSNGIMDQPRHYGSTNECPICIENVKYAIDTNCGHVFCTDCIIRNWRTNVRLSPMLCPCCRQEVTLLLTRFSDEEINNAEVVAIAERERLRGEVGQYNRLYSSYPNSWFGRVRDMRTLLPHLWRELFTWQGIETLSHVRVLICLVAGIMYTLLPMDLVPEAFLGLLGLVDDVMVIGFLLVQVSLVYRTVVANRD